MGKQVISYITHQHEITYVNLLLQTVVLKYCEVNGRYLTIDMQYFEFEDRLYVHRRASFTIFEFFRLIAVTWLQSTVPKHGHEIVALFQFFMNSRCRPAIARSHPPNDLTFCSFPYTYEVPAIIIVNDSPLCDIVPPLLTKFRNLFTKCIMCRFKILRTYWEAALEIDQLLKFDFFVRIRNIRKRIMKEMLKNVHCSSPKQRISTLIW